MERPTLAQPKLADLMARFLDNQCRAQAAGLAALPSEEVVPFEAGPVQPIDPQPAWEEALVALGLVADDAGSLPAPPAWPQLVSAHEPVVALAFCVGNFPQLMRNFHMILHKADLQDLKPQAGRPVNAPALLEWAEQVARQKRFPDVLVALAALRLAKQFDKAVDLLAACEKSVPAEWRAAWDNEKAALAWHRGQAEEARNLWHALPASVPVLFNRGMADLFCGKRAEAHASLSQAVAQLPEEGAWYHLGQLYLTLARGRE